MVFVCAAWRVSIFRLGKSLGRWVQTDLVWFILGIITVIVRVTRKVSPVKCDLVGWTAGVRVSDSVVNC